MNAQTLIIGYGNTLRCDDGVGPRLAQIVASWQLPQVQSLAMHGLAPEVADAVAQCERVLFADAAMTTTSFQVLTLRPVPYLAVAAHASDPAGILALTLALYGRCPDAWLLILPAENLDLGDELSAAAQRGLDAALNWVRRWLPGEEG